MHIYINKHYFIIALFSLALILFAPCLFAQTNGNKVEGYKESLRNAKTDTDRIKLMLQLSKASSCDDTNSKLSYANEALNLSEKIKWNKGIHCTYLALGNIYWSCMKNYPITIKYYQLCLSLSETSGDQLNLVQALTDLGSCYYAVAQYRRSMEFFRQVLEMQTNAYDKMGALGNMGIIYTDIADYPHALACYDSSLRLLNENIKNKPEFADTMQMGLLIVSIGDIYFAMSEYDKALENYNNALTLFRSTRKKEFELYALKGLGKTYKYKEDYARAIEYYEDALQDCIKMKFKNDEPEILDDLANVYLAKGDIPKAMEYAENSLQLTEENNYKDLLPATYTTLGKIYTLQKKYNDAITYLQKAITICKETGALDNEKNAWQVLSNTYEQTQQPDLAFDAFRHFISIRDSVYNIGKANDITRMDLQFGYKTDSLKHADEYNLQMQKQRVFTYSGFIGLALVLLLSFFIYRNYSQVKKANITISKANKSIKEEKQVSETLLHNILPEEVAKELKTKGNVHAKLFDHVSILFTDFVNFTEAGERLSPEELVDELNHCFMAFDNIISKYNIEKIKTVGDAYIAVSGLPNPNPHHATDIVLAAIEFRDFMINRRKEAGDNTFAMRIGINSGTVVAGIVGIKKFAYDIWGDSVNIAARMEQNSVPGKINISQTTYELVKDKFVCEYRGEIDAKNKGKLKMYFVSPLPS